MSAREHWSSYWTSSDTKAACLPDASSPAAQALDERWADLAADLPEGAKVVDLACGMGAAGQAMLAAAPHLDITGVDYADIVDAEAAGFPVMGGVDLADLPLEDGSVDCAISQYGFEYAGEGAAGELVRILAPGAKCRLLVHHRSSAIVRTNQVRAAILASLIARNPGALVADRNPEGLQIVFDHMVQTFGEHPLVLEIASAARDSLRLPDAEREAAAGRLSAGMRRERSLLDALADAAMDAEDVADFQSGTASGIEWAEPAIIRADPSDDALILCWELDGQRRST